MSEPIFDPATLSKLREIHEPMEIRDEAGYCVPGGPADEMGELFATIMANQPD